MFVAVPVILNRSNYSYEGCCYNDRYEPRRTRTTKMANSVAKQQGTNANEIKVKGKVNFILEKVSRSNKETTAALTALNFFKMLNCAS